MNGQQLHVVDCDFYVGNFLLLISLYCMFVCSSLIDAYCVTVCCINAVVIRLIVTITTTAAFVAVMIITNSAV